MCGIIRVDNDNSHTHSWVVTISRNRRTFFKSFADVIYGGKGRSLAAAKRYCNEIISKYPPLTMKEFCSIKKRHNRSGVPGVCRYVDKSGTNNDPTVYWIARCIQVQDKRKLRKFSVKKYGEEGAFRLAVEAREEALNKLVGYFDPAEKKRDKLKINF